MEIYPAKEENLSVIKMKMGFSVEDTINNLKQKDLVTITEINAFKEGTKWFIISMLAKLFEKRESININEVIRAVLNPLLFFYEKILHSPKGQKAQKRNQANKNKKCA